jgi:hypothetical protein
MNGPRAPLAAAASVAPPPPALALRLEQLAAWYGSLTPIGLARIGEFYRRDARFKDPFNDVVGLAQIERIFTHMFDNTESPRFIVRETLAGADRAYLLWDFEFGLRGRRFLVHGATHLVFDETGQVREHRDYWDPTEELWQHLPVIGAPVRWLRRRLRAR